MKIDPARRRTVQIHTQRFAASGFGGFESLLKDRLSWLFDDDNTLAAVLTEIGQAISRSELTRKVRAQGDGLAVRKQIADLQGLYSALMEAAERLFPAHIPASALLQMNAHYTARYGGEANVMDEIKRTALRLSNLAECIQAVDLTPTGITNPGKPERDALIRALLGIFEKYLGADYTGGASDDGEIVKPADALHDKQCAQRDFIKAIFEVYGFKKPMHLGKLIARLEKIPL